MIDDIEFLVAQTFAGVSKSFDQDFIFQNDLPITPETSGLIYWIQKSESTFIIRAITCENIRYSLELVNNKDAEILAKLKFQDTGVEVNYYACENLEHAQLIVKSMTNRRFPLHEERLFNVSDPSISWWMKVSSLKMELLFNLSHTHELDSLVKLGPIYDHNLALYKFQKLSFFLKALLPLKTFSFTNSHIEISLMQVNAHFELLKLVFEKGEFKKELKMYFEVLSKKVNPKHQADWNSCICFLNEIAVLRKFWIKTQSEIFNGN